MKSKGPCAPMKAPAPAPPASKAGRMPHRMPPEVKAAHGKGGMPKETRDSFKK